MATTRHSARVSPSLEASKILRDLYEFLEDDNHEKSPRKKQRVSSGKRKAIFDPRTSIDELFENDVILSKTEILVVCTSAGTRQFKS